MKFTNSLIKLAKKLEIKYAQDQGGMYGSGGDLINNPPLGLYGIPFKIPVTVPIIKNKKAITDVTIPFVRDASEDDIKLGRKSWWGQHTLKPTSWHINGRNQPVLIDWPRYGDVSIQNKVGRLASYSTPTAKYIDDSLVRQDSRFKADYAGSTSNAPAAKTTEIIKKEKEKEIKSFYLEEIKEIASRYNLKIDPNDLLTLPIPDNITSLIEKQLPNQMDQDAFISEMEYIHGNINQDLNEDFPDFFYKDIEKILKE